MTEELLPCPFCGNKAILITDYATVVVCSNPECFISLQAQHEQLLTTEMALKAWNTRTNGVANNCFNLTEKGDLAERLLLAYSTIQSLELERLRLAKSLYLAASDFTSSNGIAPGWWVDCKEIARKTLELEGAKNTEQQVQPDGADKPLAG